MVNNEPGKQKEVDKLSGVETTGHEWDGLKELNNPAPRWWLWVFFVCIIFSVGYWYVYPAWPTLTGFTSGNGNWSEYSQLKASQSEIANMRSKYEPRFATADLNTIKNDKELYAYAVAGGAVAFKNNCAACHGSGGQGGKGYPNLNDDMWLWGGSLDQIYASIRYGAHNENQNSHQGGMPPWKDSLKPEEIDQVATYVEHMHAGDKTPKTAAYTSGKEVYSKNCVSCHGDNGEGKIDVGAPQLNSGIFMFGGEHANIVQSITYGRTGVMPVWEGRLDNNTVKQLAVYVHALGGGK